MKAPVVFPARKSLQSGEHEGTILFEVFSSGELSGISSRTLDPITVSGETWQHYLVELSRKEHGEFLEDNNVYREEFANDVSNELFSKHFDRSRKTELMGILNVTPDSFYPGSRIMGRSLSEIDAILEEGPDIIDVGGESTRPGSEPVPPDKEIERIEPILDYVSSSYDVPISVDTRNPETAEFAVRFGVKYLNDVSGFRSDRMMKVAEENSLDCVLMHMRGEPKTMQVSTSYADILLELNLFFQERVSRMLDAGLHPSRIILDPGIGFGKGMSGNISIIRDLRSMNTGFRTLVGHSRKTFIGKITGNPVDKRLGGTLGVSVFLRKMGADILRVHDVSENRDALAIYDLLSDEV